jgi:hypothetical protein
MDKYSYDQRKIKEKLRKKLEKHYRDMYKAYIEARKTELNFSPNGTNLDYLLPIYFSIAKVQEVAQNLKES